MTPLPRQALVTGIHGQDGWYLAQHLLALGYQVVGTTHRPDGVGVEELNGRPIPVRHLDLSNSASILEILRQVNPSHVFNLAARASSAQLFDDPLGTTDANGVAVVRLLEAIRAHNPAIRLCQASSCEVFAGAATSPQDEDSPRTPLSAYGCAKAFADQMIAAYRRTHGLFACSAILYPHESPRRDKHFLVRKVTMAAAAIALGRARTVEVGDLATVRDWGFAPDYMAAMVMMLERANPLDFVLATGEGHSVAEVCQAAFDVVRLPWADHVVTNPTLGRGADPIPKIGNSSRARQLLGWKPSLRFAEMIHLLVKSEIALLSQT